jgi:glycosyl transferase family 1
VIARENVRQIEDHLQAADIGLFTSESEGFCLSILEAMCFACPSIASQVGGIPEVVENRIPGLLVPFGDTEKIVLAAEDLIQNPARRETLGCAAQLPEQTHFSAKIIVRATLAVPSISAKEAARSSMREILSAVPTVRSASLRHRKCQKSNRCDVSDVQAQTAECNLP